jgi:hypothetical protein
MEAYLQLGRRADARALSGRLTTGLASPPADDAALLAFQLGATRAIARTAVDDRSKVLVTGSPVSGASLRDPWPHRFGLGFVAAWHAWPGGDPGLLHTARQSLETLGSGGPADGGDPEIELARALLEATMAASQDEHPTVALLMDHAADREAELRRTGRVALPLVPARELEAELWLRFYRYGDAEREARAALERSPNRWRPWLTIARAAAALGRDADARAAFERVAAIRARADADDPAIREARQALQPRIGTGGAIREDGTLAWRAGIGGGVPVRRAAPRTKGGPS